MKNEVQKISLPVLKGESMPQKALELVNNRLPEISKKTEAFNRSNSQTSLSMMTLTMMNGQSPMRQIRQILAEIEKRYGALSEAQVNYAKLESKIANFVGTDTVADAEYRKLNYDLRYLENKVSGSVKDLATLIQAYDNLVSNYGIEQWSEEDYERAEAKHHVRRGFELLYQNLIGSTTPSISSVEYLHQFGVHIQVAVTEVRGYIIYVEEMISKGEIPSSSHFENFLDEMADKYEHCVKEASKRMFGSEDICNADFMTSWKK